MEQENTLQDQEIKQPNKNKWLQFTLKLIIAIIPGLLLLALFIIDRVITLPLLHRGQYPIQDCYRNLKLFIPITYRVGGVAILVLINWLILTLF